jgi:hypothetical protein
MSDICTSDLGLRSDRRCCACPASSHLSYDAGVNRRGGEHRLQEPELPLQGLRPGHSQANKPDRGTTCGSLARHGARERTVHQERYNPLKVGYQPQDPRAKVQQDFGVRSVTWLA